MRNPNCKLCGRNEFAKNVCIYGQSLYKEPSVMVITDNISYAQNDNNVILIGQGGNLLIKLFAELGILEQCYFTAAVKCYASDKPKIGEIRKCNIYLQEEIDFVKPKLIICLGSIAAASIFNKNVPLKHLRQRIFEYKNAKVGVTYSHNVIFVEPNKYNQLKKDLKWIINNVVSKEETGLDYKLELDKEITPSNIYGLDIETVGENDKDGLNVNKGKILTIAVANPITKISVGYNINYTRLKELENVSNRNN